MISVNLTVHSLSRRSRTKEPTTPACSPVHPVHKVSRVNLFPQTLHLLYQCTFDYLLYLHLYMYVVLLYAAVPRSIQDPPPRRSRETETRRDCIWNRRLSCPFALLRNIASKLRQDKTNGVILANAHTVPYRTQIRVVSLLVHILRESYMVQGLSTDICCTRPRWPLQEQRPYHTTSYHTI